MLSSKMALRCGAAFLTLALFASLAAASDCPQVVRVVYPDYAVAPYFSVAGTPCIP